jgi:CubicO group peptidase (beta-lactamase class C family)
MHAYRTLQKVPGLVSIVTNCICAQSMALRPKRVRRELIGMAFIASIVATVCVSGQSQRPALTPPQLASIDTFVTAEMRKEHIPGVAVGVYSRGTMLLAKGYGFSNVELDVPVKVGTVFQSGSVGKQFVSTAAMMLVEDGKLSLDDSIAKYFPDAPATWQSIKLKNLLSHTSGLAEYETPDRTSRSGPFYMRLDFTEDELVKKIQALPIEGAPGEKWAYRNTNYVLVGILIHRVTGMSYTDFLTKRIFLPLGMSSTRPISDGGPRTKPCGGIRVARRAVEKSTVGFPNIQLHGRWDVVLQRARSGEMGRGPLWYSVAAAIESRSHVDRVSSQQWPAERWQLWIWMGAQSTERAPTEVAVQELAAMRCPPEVRTS